MNESTPAFAEPWHAQIFALTLHLSEKGAFSWGDWTQAFGATLKRHGASRALDGGEDYFAAWLETLEAMLTAQGISGGDLDRVAADWTRAYLATPHGAPVRLPG